MVERHPSGCSCEPPTIAKDGHTVLAVETCPKCLAWSRMFRYEQLEHPGLLGVPEVSEGDDRDHSASLVGGPDVRQDLPLFWEGDE